MTSPRRTSLTLAALIATAAILMVAPTATAPAVAGDDPEPTVPGEGALNADVLAVLATYPADGSHGYYWPKSGDWAGTTRDLDYGGTRVASGDAEGRAYCCGLTFEVFFRAWERWCAREKRPLRIGALDGAGVIQLRKLWYGSDEEVGEENVRRTMQHALVSTGLGVAVEPKDARPGDFVQLWRSSGSGHSVIFRGWRKDARGRITALRYWSTQKSTDGIGENEEKLTTAGGKVLLGQTYIVRVGRD